MRILRKLVVHFLALILFISLLGAALSTTLNWGFSKPTRVENWLSQSNVYSQLPSAVTKDIPSSVTVSIDNQSVAIPLDQSTINQASQASFPPQLIQNDVGQFLNANYDWLEGKTSIPNFRIDISAPETSFGQNIAKILETRFASLPTCTAAQLKQIGTSFNLATATCLPPGLDLTPINAQIIQQVSSSTNLPSDAVLTPTSLSKNSTSKPYYQTASRLPKAYRAAVKLPLLLSIVSLLCIVGIVFIAPRKRRGIRRLVWVLSEAGIILVLTRVATYIIFKKYTISVFSSVGNSQLETALNDLLRRVSTDLSTINLWFGVGYLVAAIALFLLLIFTKGRGAKQPKPAQETVTTEPTIPSTSLPPISTYKKANPQTQPKRPRLIQ